MQVIKKTFPIENITKKYHVQKYQKISGKKILKNIMYKKY